MFPQNAPSRTLLLFAAAAAFLPACGGGVPILMYHSVSAGTDPLGVSPAQLDAHLEYLSAAGFKTISLHEMFEASDGHGKLPGNPIVLTFDDGTEDAIAIALPILQKRGQKATFFVVAGFTAADEAHRFTQPTSRGERRYLVWPEVLRLRGAGMEIGSHSLSHPRLVSLGREQMRNEVMESKLRLEQGLGESVEFFAYPFSARKRAVRKLVERAGYRGAVSGPSGGTQPSDLQRLIIRRSTSAEDLRDMLRTDWASSYASGGR